ncbi:hypothetical protein FJW04_06265 [Mesorhizobium sp. B2-7-3]|uniref:hypothetical protein n=1 Tax=Mesorhizobium sp. B2-7-3 TaxID=2589907 RepID=UPI00112D9052|nr:hypothetical protein [Mesorhizobium sp. B2-7-3]TPJ18911.1 hypothetical protein FJW04_06265 [Mesorhizobium sp. B2-7-3]
MFIFISSQKDQKKGQGIFFAERQHPSPFPTIEKDARRAAFSQFDAIHGMEKFNIYGAVRR